MSSTILSELTLPIVQAPMAGGPSTPELAAAVNRAGGLGFVAAGYLSPERLAADLDALSAITDRPFGVNMFVGGDAVADPELVATYGATLVPEARRAGVELGTPRHDDDGFAAKVRLLVDRPVPVVSFTFGAPPRSAVSALRAAGCEVWVTVTSPEEARAAEALDVDALVVQGLEAGGHRGVFVDDDEQSDLTLLAALQLIAADVRLPLVAAGSIMTGTALAAVLAAGAGAGQVGSAYLLSAEAGTSPVQRVATATPEPTVLTRAFSGRTARGIVNRWHREYAAQAPRAYPEVHHLTSPLRARGRALGDPDVLDLWAGQGHVLAQERSAEEITRELAAGAREALAAATRRWGSWNARASR